MRSNSLIFKDATKISQADRYMLHQFSHLLIAAAQTFTHCDPLYGKCDADPALGSVLNVNFVNDGPSASFMRTGSSTIVYDPQDGAEFTVAGSGSNPTLQSRFYIMFGKISVVARAAPGQGIVSSIVLQSDDLDEIDIEFVGNDAHQMQTNFFSKGDTSTYDRGQYHQVGEDVTNDYHKFTIDWSPDVLKWYIDEQLLRTLHFADKPDYYPQTPMTVRLGAWAAGDPTNPEGTIQWAGGVCDYSAGPFVYNVKSINIEDYSTGTNYEYMDQSGSWTSIRAHNGQVSANDPAQGTGSRILQNLQNIYKFTYYHCQNIITTYLLPLLTDSQCV